MGTMQTKHATPRAGKYLWDEPRFLLLFRRHLWAMKEDREARAAELKGALRTLRGKARAAAIAENARLDGAMFISAATTEMQATHFYPLAQAVVLAKRPRGVDWDDAIDDAVIDCVESLCARAKMCGDGQTKGYSPAAAPGMAFFRQVIDFSIRRDARRETSVRVKHLRIADDYAHTPAGRAEGLPAIQRPAPLLVGEVPPVWDLVPMVPRPPRAPDRFGAPDSRRAVGSL